MLSLKSFRGLDRTLGTRLAARSLILRDIGETTFQPLDGASDSLLEIARGVLCVLSARCFF